MELPDTSYLRRTRGSLLRNSDGYLQILACDADRRSRTPAHSRALLVNRNGTAARRGLHAFRAGAAAGSIGKTGSHYVGRETTPYPADVLLGLITNLGCVAANRTRPLAGAPRYHGWRHAYARSSPLDWPVFTFFAALLLSALLSPAIRSSLVGLRKLWLVGAFFVVYHLIRRAARSLAVGVADVDRHCRSLPSSSIFQYFTGIDLDKQLTGRPSDLTSFLVGGQEEFRAEGFFPTGITYAHNLCFSLTLLTARFFAPDLNSRVRECSGV